MAGGPGGEGVSNCTIRLFPVELLRLDVELELESTCSMKFPVLSTTGWPANADGGEEGPKSTGAPPPATVARAIIMLSG